MTAVKLFSSLVLPFALPYFWCSWSQQPTKHLNYMAYLEPQQEVLKIRASMPVLMVLNFSVFISFPSQLLIFPSLLFHSMPICCVLRLDMSTSLLSLHQERNLKHSKHFHVLVFRVIFFVSLDNKLDH